MKMLKYDDKVKQNTSQGRLQSKIKLFLILFLGVVLSVFLIGFVSAGVLSSGTKTYIDIGGLNYTIETFTSNGTFNWTGTNLNVSILVVAGGGGGGAGTYLGAGGGAGGLIYNESFDIIPSNFNIVIGKGGIGGIDTTPSYNGEDSFIAFSNGTKVKEATGGGRAGGRNNGAGDVNGGNGGSGGGATDGGTDTGGTGIAGQGNNGGNWVSAGGNAGAGGGGAGSVGLPNVAAAAGNGGTGLSFTIYNGTSICYAGGGGGGSNGGTQGVGTCGGGSGTASNGENGINGTGGGGGGGERLGAKTGGTGGDGIVIIRYKTSDAEIPFIPSVTLNSPTNNSIVSTTNVSFTSNLTMTGANYSYQWKNNTFHIWYNNGTLFNTTFANGLSTNQTNVSREIGNFILGTYLWNSYACYDNVTFANCTWATNNYTLTKGSSLVSINYNNNTYETAYEQFIVNVSLAEGAEVSLVQLVYNGTNYTISNVSSSGGYYSLERKINIPLNVNPAANQTNEFYIRFTYGGASVQTFGPYEQNSSFINLVQCGGAYTTQALNFTFYDEYIQSNINATKNKTTLYSSFKYWLGEGSVYKNYSFQNITSTLNNYQFCISPYLPNNYTFKTNMDMEFYAEDFRENKYYLRNSTLTNTSNNILLYLIPEEYATKFFLTFKQGTNTISDATVTVQKYFTGLGMYKTVAILLTDADGKATMWQEVDKTFKYSIVKDGVLLGVVERVSICSATPCSLTIMTTTVIGSAFEAYDDYYAANVLSNLSYNKNTSMVTYSFIDITGLANYFRLEVKQVKLNSAAVTICDSTVYSSAGTLSCNLTGYEGDFFATGYVSRSPEKVDKILSFVIDEDVLGDLGITGVFIVMILLITLVIAAAVISRGNPTTVLFVLGMSILGTKLIGLFPFTWIVVVTLEVLIIFMIFKIKT